VIGVKPVRVAARMMVFEEVLRLPLTAEVRAVAIDEGAGGLCGDHRDQQAKGERWDDQAASQGAIQDTPPMSFAQCDSHLYPYWYG
jgi:hypothetical protein